VLELAMAESVLNTEAPTTALDGRPAVWPAGEVVRDIARGGIAGIVVGILVGGLGGRLVMRLATILHEDRVGLGTENGEVIGAITVDGTIALMIFGGLGMGLLAGTIWVIVGPWIPGRGLGRAVATAVAAIALGTPSLIERTNPDFAVLGRDPLVVALLVALVGAFGFAIAIVDGALDGRLPRPRRGPTVATTTYLVIAALGCVLILPLAVAILLDQPQYSAAIRAGWALAVTGGCTVAWWVLRAKGETAPPRALLLAGRASFAVAVFLGIVTTVPQVLGALGIRT
jgi:hypothetical protein